MENIITRVFDNTGFSRYVGQFLPQGKITKIVDATESYPCMIIEFDSGKNQKIYMPSITFEME